MSFVLDKADPHALPVHFPKHILLPVNPHISYSRTRKDGAYFFLCDDASVWVGHAGTCVLCKYDIHAMTIRYPNAACQEEGDSRGVWWFVSSLPQAPNARLQLLPKAGAERTL
jgi:hypothetical protein